MKTSRCTVMKLHTGSVASTPTVWVEAEGSAVTGITFRVGLADEPLTHRGITGLLTRLITEALLTQGVIATTQIGAQRTTISTLGDPVRFTEVVETWLGSPDFLTFGEVLQLVKAKPLQVTPVGEHFMARFGNVGPGRQNLPKLGLDWLQPEQVTHWAVTYFNAANSSLWTVGPTPPASGISLPAGRAVAVASPVHKGPWETPQWFPTIDESDRHTSFSILVDDRPETIVIRNVLEIATARTLAEQHIAATAPATSFDSIGDGIGQLHLSVETEPELRDQTMAELRNMVSTMALGGCREADLDLAVAESIRRDGELSGLIAYATRAAFNRLCDRPTPVPVMRGQVYASVTPEKLASSLEAAWTTLVWTSASVSATRPTAEVLPIAGVSFEKVARDAKLTVGDTGLWYEQHDQVTALGWRDIEAVVHVGDDQRCLYAKDGPPLEFSSSDWTEGSDLIGDIDRHLPRSRHIYEDHRTGAA